MQLAFTILGAASQIPASAGGLLDALTDPLARFALLAIFLISLYVAMHIPGHGLAETVGLICLALLIGAPLIAGVAPWWTAAAIVVGLILIAVEVFIIPGFGLPGLAGLILFFGGLIFLFASPDPSALRWASLQKALILVTSSLVCSVAACLLLRRHLPRIPYLRGIILSPKEEADEPPPPAATREIWPFVGSVGTAITDLKPGGSAEFPFGHEHRKINVVCDGRFLPAGSRIIVHEIAGNRILVRVMDQTKG